MTIRAPSIADRRSSWLVSEFSGKQFATVRHQTPLSDALGSKKYLYKKVALLALKFLNISVSHLKAAKFSDTDFEGREKQIPPIEGFLPSATCHHNSATVGHERTEASTESFYLRNKLPPPLQV